MSDKYEHRYPLYDSIEEMLSPRVMSILLKSKVSEVTYKPFSAKKGTSGNQMYNVLVDNERLVMKHLSPQTEWKSIASHDKKCRSVRVWQYGLLDGLLPDTQHVTLAACRDGDDYAILMHDVSSGLFDDRQVTREDVFTLLNSMAAMHALYWEDEKLRDPEIGLCNLQTLLEEYWLSHLDLYKHDLSAVDIVKNGWEALMDSFDHTVRVAVQSLLDNPLPLLNALDRYPSTLIHGSLHFLNCALLPDTGQVVIFDWEDATYGLCAIDLSWFILLPAVFDMRDEAAHYYLQQLSSTLGSRFDRNQWQAMFDIGMLFNVLSKGIWWALFAAIDPIMEKQERYKKIVASYNGIVRNGVNWL